MLRGAARFASADFLLKEFLVPLRRSHDRSAQFEVRVELRGAPGPMRERLMRVCEFSTAPGLQEIGFVEYTHRGVRAMRVLVLRRTRRGGVRAVTPAAFR